MLDFAENGDVVLKLIDWGFSTEIKKGEKLN